MGPPRLSHPGWGGRAGGPVWNNVRSNMAAGSGAALDRSTAQYITCSISDYTQALYFWLTKFLINKRLVLVKKNNTKLQLSLILSLIFSCLSYLSQSFIQVPLFLQNRYFFRQICQNRRHIIISTGPNKVIVSCLTSYSKQMQSVY